VREETVKAKTIALAGLFLMALAPGAWALGRGTTMFAIQIGQGKADLMNPLDPGNPNDHYTGVDTGDPNSQMDVRVEVWRLLRDDYAFSIAGGIGFYSNTDKPGNAAPVALEDQKFSSSSFFVRVGGDRVGTIGKRFDLFAGPGIEYWSGRARYKNIYDDTPPYDDVTGPTTTRISLTGRIGAFMKLSETLGLVASLGSRIGYASSEDKGAKSTWYPGGNEGAVGLVFTLGGD
jgi:hypothetical protein